MTRTAPAAFIAFTLTFHSAAADLFFADFFAFERISEFDFGYRDSVPAVEIAYVRSGVGDTFTDVTVTLDGTGFEILGHSCPTRLANGSSCMIFVAFDPPETASGRVPNVPDEAVFKTELKVASNEGSASLTISGHRNSRYCTDQRLPPGPRCATPRR
jgi:hypothetical protein